MATVVACGGFAAVCGSSLATAATMAKVAMPSMRRYGFSDTLAVGSIAAGGTLGILIPPSVILVIYGIMTGTDIGKLFLGGILPGLLTIGLYMLTIAITTTINPASGPRTERIGFAERFRRLKRVTAMVFLFLFIIGGIYLGIFTPTEAGGAGAFGALIFALWRRALTFSVFMECLLETAKMTTMLFIVLVGAIIFSNFVNLAGLPEALSKLITSQGVGPMGVIFNMMMVYLLLGCFLDSLAMILLTVPIFFPIVSGLGLNPIWFGIVVVMISELALITPPVGMNLFVIKSTVDGVTLPTIYRGIIPFAIADVVRITAVILFPGIPLLLPRLAG
jgi:tripartite ATP-independent transporter DctM subunit